MNASQKFVIANRFEINDLEKDLLGRGGMGVVYRALDTQSGETVAVKALNADALAVEPGVLERFRREGQALRQLNHPNIVKYIGALETNDQHYLVMEYVEGGSLQDLLTTRGCLPAAQVIKITLEIADALTRAHHLGIIHRDLKPANVLLAQDGTPRLTDFGIAQLADSPRLTQTGVLVGSVNYLCPEALNDETLDARADVWAFGVLLFEMLTGKLPFTGANLSARITAILNQPAPDISQYNPDIPGSIADLICRMLEKDRDQRIPSMRQVGAELESISKGWQGAPAPGESRFKTPVSWMQKPKNNLPSQLTTFIGREKEMEQIKKRLEKVHLVTLTGSGGIGKTRLSIQVASELLNDYPIGVWLVELAPLTDPALVPQSVCAALGVTPEGNTTALEALIDYLRAKKILLVVDNCEHLIDACAQLCDALLHACADLRIITSSREALGIEGENAYRVPSLSLPDPKSGLQTIEESEAVRLFVERATTLLPEFEMTEANAPAIAQICQRLDGIALAIELAASRVKMLKVEQIATRLDDAFRLLTGGSRTALPRQQTLRALIDWSYNLLPDAEKTVLRKLSIFMGGWTLEAAEAICGNADALDLLTHLVDKSLVSVDLEHGDEPRYYLLETVRQYAREKLVEIEDPARLRDVHLDYFIKLAERIAPELYRRKMPDWLDYLEMEYPNFQAALEWVQERDVEAGLRLCNALFRFWENRADYRKEGLEWFEKFLMADTASRTALRAWALYHAAMLFRANDMLDPQNKQLLEESLPLAREMDEHACVARILIVLGDNEGYEENFDKAHAWFEESLSEARLANDEFAVGKTILSLSNLAVLQSDYETARSLAEESLTIFRRTGELTGWFWSLNGIAWACRCQGDWNASRGCEAESLALAQEIRDRLHTSIGLLNLGSLARDRGDFDQALSLYEQCRKLVQDTPDDRIMYASFLDIGEIARIQGKYDEAILYYEKVLVRMKSLGYRATTYLGLANAERLRNHLMVANRHLITALNLLKTKQDHPFWGDVTSHQVWADTIAVAAYFAIGQHKARQAAVLFGWTVARRKLKRLILAPVYQAEFDRYMAQAREQLTEAEFNAAWAEGQSMSQEQILAFAEEVVK